MLHTNLSRSARALVVLAIAASTTSRADAQTADASPATVEAHHHLATSYDDAALGHLRALYQHVMARSESGSAPDALLLVETMQAIASALRWARQHQDSADGAMTSQQRSTHRARIDEIRSAYADAMREQRILEAESTRRTPNLSVIAERVRAEHGAVMRAMEAQAILRRSLGVPDARAVAPSAPLAPTAAVPPRETASQPVAVRPTRARPR